MARPCGCTGTCGCTIVGVDGVRATGSGSVRDPILIGLSNPLGGNGCEAVMDCVGGNVGTGLSYNDGLGIISTRISGDSGNVVTYGTDGGLYSTGTAGGGGSTGVTLASLPATNIVGGSYGAGNTQLPEGPLKTYQAAMDMDLTMIHVPVRRLSDFWLAASHYRAMNGYDVTLGGSGTETTQTWDIKSYKRLIYRPSGAPSGSTWDPLGGYFGMQEPDTTYDSGGTLLADVFRVTNKRKVLYLELKDIGSSVGDTSNPDQTAGMLLALLQTWGLTQSVIVGSELPLSATQADFDAIIAGLQLLATNGVAVAAHLTSKAMMDAVTPANLVAKGIGWVFLPVQAAMDNQAQATAYKTAGRQVMLHGGHRHVHYELQRTLAFRGILATDPYYTQGWANAFRYRKETATWSYTPPDYGRHAYAGDSLTTHRSFDGYQENGNPGKVTIRADAVPPGETTSLMRTGYYVLAGEQCPIRDPAHPALAPGQYGTPTNYDIEIGFSWSALVSDHDRWTGVWFGAPDDQPILEFARANIYTRGYEFQLSQAGDFAFHRYDGIPYTGPYPTVSDPAQYSAGWASTWGTITPGTEYRVLIQVRPGAVTVGRLGSGSTVLNGRTFNAATGGGDQWRGPYFHFGRHFWSTSDSALCRYHNLVTRIYG